MDHNISARILTALVALCLCASQASAYTVVAVSNGGSIKGTIKASSKQDETRTISKDNKFCGDSILAEKFIIGSDGALKNAVVMLEEIAEGKDFELEVDLTITNKGCHFVPHVMVAPKGGLMKVRNDDPLLHNSSRRRGEEEERHQPGAPQGGDRDQQVENPQEARTALVGVRLSRFHAGLDLGPRAPLRGGDRQ